MNKDSYKLVQTNFGLGRTLTNKNLSNFYTTLHKKSTLNFVE